MMSFEDLAIRITGNSLPERFQAQTGNEGEVGIDVER
jgi:hypothetical protein